MKLICGMPRSGTKYLLNMFNKYGKDMKPKIYCHNTNFNSSWSTNEAEAISYAYHRGIEGYLLINLFQALPEIWKEDKTDDTEVMYKQPQLCFLRKELILFSEIIICKRPVESWVKSASIYSHAQIYVDRKNRPMWLKKYDDRIYNSSDKFLELGKIWEENCDESIEFLKIRKIKYHICEFGNIEHYKNLFSHFELSTQAIEDCLKNWAGSNTDSNYKPF